jgi:hypothetical protein
MSTHVYEALPKAYGKYVAYQDPNRRTLIGLVIFNNSSTNHFLLDTLFSNKCLENQ